jgi:hypothetical protein
MKERETLPAEPHSGDEAGETSGVSIDARMAQDRGHESDASGLSADDPARGDQRKRQRREGATEITEMD